MRLSRYFWPVRPKWYFRGVQSSPLLMDRRFFVTNSKIQLELLTYSTQRQRSVHNFICKVSRRKTCIVRCPTEVVLYNPWIKLFVKGTLLWWGNVIINWKLEFHSRTQLSNYSGMPEWDPPPYWCRNKTLFERPIKASEGKFWLCVALKENFSTFYLMKSLSGPYSGISL